MSKSVDNENYLENVKNLKRLVLTSKLNIIFSKHQNKNVKNIEKFLKMLLTENDMNKIVDRLKKCSRKSVHQIAFLLKKHYDEITIENNLFFDREKNTKKEKLKLKFNLRNNIKKLNTIIESFNNQFMKAKNFRRKSFAFAIFFEVITKRFTKIFDSFFFSDEKTMSVSQ